MRTTAYRVFVLFILLVSPVLFPLLLGLLRVLDGQWYRGGLAELYSHAWKQLMRGYP